MKVIDILNKIANGEEVKFKILSVNAIYRYDKDYQLYCETSDEICEWGIDYRWLNEEVEIIEDKKIEKIKILNCDNYVKKENYETILTMQEIALDISTLKKWVNKIIDYLEDKQC